MQYGGETRKLNIICIGLVVLAALSRAAGYTLGGFSHNSIIFVLYAAAAFIWIAQINRRITDRRERRYLLWTAAMIIIWMALRTIKYDFTALDDALGRYLWYLYYAPQTLIVLMVFFTVLYIGVPEGRRISEYRTLLYIPAILIIAGIMTNDLHQLAFAFPDGLEHWYEGSSYTYGPLYYIAVAWLALMFTAILAVAMIRCVISAGRKKMWIPMIPLGAAVVYFAAFAILPDRMMLLKMPEAICLILAAFTESLIVSHLIPSNDSYGDLWNASAIGAGIMDDDGNIQLRSGDVSYVDEALIRRAENEPVMLENGTVVLKSRKIRGGYGFWTRDVSEITALNSRIKELGDVVSEENAMLEAENRLAEEKSRILQQEAIYESIALRVKPQIMKINEILDAQYRDEADFEKEMKYACILNAYIKRYSNLVLLSEKGAGPQAGELFLALDESLVYLRLYGAKAHGFYSGEGRMECDALLSAYRFFETVIEEAMPDITVLMVDVEVSGELLTMKLEMNDSGHGTSTAEACRQAEECGGTADISTDGDTVYAVLRLATGGD